MDEDQEICGVEKSIIEKIIRMVQEKYPKYDLGVYYLASLGIESDTGYHNIRDMVSHFYSALARDRTQREREDQLVSAEEHLRRALVEPYEVGAFEMFKDARVLHESILKLMMTAKRKDKDLLKASYQDRIKKQFLSINLHMTAGRQKKSANLWNKEWEQAVEEFIEAAEESIALSETLKDKLQVLTESDLYRQSRRNFVWALVVTILFGLTGVAALLVALFNIRIL